MRIWIDLQMSCMLVPFLLTEVLLCSARTESETARLRRVWLPGTGMSLLINGGAQFLCCRMLFGDWNLGSLLGRMIRMEISYQEFGRFALLLLPCLAVSLLTGGLLRCLFFRGMGSGFSRGRKMLALLLVTVAGLVSMGSRNAAREGVRQIRFEAIYRKTTLAYLFPETSAGVGSRNREIFAARLRNEGELDNQGTDLWLSEMEEDLQACAFQAVIIPAGDTQLITMAYEKGPDLEKSGGSILYLSDREGNILDQVEVPALGEGQGFIRSRETGEWTVDPPGRARRETAEIAPPVFSRDSGLYDEGFELRLEAEEGLTVHYTTDCSEPTKDSPVYDQPIPIYDRSGEENQFLSIPNIRRDYLNYSAPGQVPVDKATIIRAVTENEAGEISETVTRAYLIGKDAYRQRNVLCLIADPEDLFGAQRGIYVTGEAYDIWYTAHLKEAKALPRSLATGSDTFWAEEPTPNYYQRGAAWERKAEAICFNGERILLEQSVGIRIQGKAARGLPMKRFSIFARPEYSGSRTFDAALFNGKAGHALLLRRGELHALSQRLGEGRDVLTMPWMQTDLFLNGEYWYTAFLYEKMNKTLIANTYGVKEGNIAIVKNGEEDDMAEAGDNPYSAMNGYILYKSLDDPENYQTFSEMMDIQSYIDMNCMQAYLANTDYSEKNNMLLWHTVTEEDSPYGDTRWRWSLYDMDLVWKSAGDVENAWEINPFITYPSWRAGKQPMTGWPIFSALMKSETFRRQFVTTFLDLANTVFESDHVTRLLDEMESTDQEYRAFFAHRREFILPCLREAFGLKGSLEKITIRTETPEAGKIRLNTIMPELSGGVWSGEYFTDYPVTVTAEAAEGHRFSCWMVDGERIGTENAEISLESGTVTVTAVFDEDV